MSRLELESIGRVLNAVEGAGELAHDRALDVARGGRTLSLSTNIESLLDPVKALESASERTLANLTKTREAKRIAGTLDLARRKAGFTGNYSSSLSEVSAIFRMKEAQEQASNFGVENFGMSREASRMADRNPFATGTRSGLDIVKGPDRVVREELLKSGFAAPFEDTPSGGFLRTGGSGRLQRKVQKQALTSALTDNAVTMFELGKDDYALTNVIGDLFKGLYVYGPEGPEPATLGSYDDQGSFGKSKSSKGIKEAFDRARKAKSGPITGLDIFKQIKPDTVYIGFPDFLDEGFFGAADVTDIIKIDREGFVSVEDTGFMRSLDDLAAKANQVDDLIEAEKNRFSLLKPLQQELEGIKKRFFGKLPGFPLPATNRMGGNDLSPASVVLRFPTEKQKSAFSLVPPHLKDPKGEALFFAQMKGDRFFFDSRDGKIKAPFGYADSKNNVVGASRFTNLELPEEVFKDVKQDEVAKVVRAVRETKDLRFHLLELDPENPVAFQQQGARGYAKRHLLRDEIAPRYMEGMSAERKRVEILKRLRRVTPQDIFNLVLNDKDFAEFKRDVDARFFRQSKEQMTIYGRASVRGGFNMESAAKQLVKDIEKIRALNLSPEALYLGLQASRDTMSSPNSALGILRMAGPAFEGQRTALESKFAKAGVETADEAARTFRSTLRKLVGPSAAVASGALGESLSREIASTFANASSPKDLAERLQAVRRKIMSGQVRAIRATYPEPELQRYHIRNMVNRFADVLPENLPYKVGAVEDLGFATNNYPSMVEARAERIRSKLIGREFGVDPNLERRLLRLGLREGQGLGMLLSSEAKEITPLQDSMRRMGPRDEAIMKRLRMMQSDKQLAALTREADLPILAAMQSEAEVGRRQFLGRVMRAAAQATPQTRAALQAAGAVQEYTNPAHVSVTREVANSQVLKGMLSFIRKFPGVP